MVEPEDGDGGGMVVPLLTTHTINVTERKEEMEEKEKEEGEVEEEGNYLP